MADLIAPGMYGPEIRYNMDRLRLGNALRTAANSAANNPLVQAPWTIAPSHQTSTDYPLGSVVSAVFGGITRYYIQLAGSSPVSGATAPTWRDDAVSIADGTCNWIWCGDQPMAASDSNAPTITNAVGTIPFSGALNWYPATYPELYTLQGCDPITYVGLYWTFKTFEDSASTSSSLGGVVSAFVDDTKFAIAATSNTASFGVVIDGRFVGPQTVLSQSSLLFWQIYDFGKRKVRKVEIVHGKSSSNFGGIATTSSGIVHRSSSPEINAVFIGDSFGAGANPGPFRSEGVLGTQIGMRLGWNVRNMVTGATGYVNPGSSKYTYLQRVQNSFNSAKIAAANIIVIYGSTNDNGNPSGVTTAVSATITAIRALNNLAPIVLFGPASINASSALIAANKATDTAVAAGVTASGDTNTYYFPFANDPQPPIASSSYLATVPSGIDTYTKLIYTGDGIHPSDLGTFTLAEWMAHKIASGVLPLV